MQLPNLLILTLLLSSAQAQAQSQKSNSSSTNTNTSTRTRARSLKISARPTASRVSFSPALSTLPPNTSPKVVVPPARAADAIPALRARDGNNHDLEVLPRKAKPKTTTTGKDIPSSVPADPILPREEMNGDSKREMMYIRQDQPIPSSSKPKLLKSTKQPNSGGSGSAGNGTSNDTPNPQPKAPKSKAAKTTGNARARVIAAAVPIPTDAPTIAFPSKGATLPLIPTPKPKAGSGGGNGAGRVSSSSSSSSSSSVVPTTLARRVRKRNGDEEAEREVEGCFEMAGLI